MSLCSARLISFEIKLISKEISRAEQQYMNVQPQLKRGFVPACRTQKNVFTSM